MLNKLYILGALALSASASSTAGTVDAAGTTFSIGKGGYTYTISGDCNASMAGLTILGMFNIYKSYWSFTLS